MALLLVNNIECWELLVIGQLAMNQSYYWQGPQFATLLLHYGKTDNLGKPFYEQKARRFWASKYV